MKTETVFTFLQSIYRLLTEGVDDSLAVEYSALFEYGDADIVIPLQESAYRNNMNVLLDETTVSVIRAYYAVHMQVAHTSEPADSLVVQTEFLLYLLSQGDTDRYNAFFRDHYAFLLANVFRRVRQHAQADYFKDTASAVLQHAERFLSLPADFSRDALGETARQFVPPHFVPISDAEIREKLTEKVVLTAGKGNCGGRCVIKAHTVAGCITHLESEIYDDSARKLVACVRGRGYRKTFLTAERLRYPMVRVGERGEGTFKRISWEAAIDLIHKKLTDITKTYGIGSRYVNYGSGDTGVLRGGNLMKRLLSFDGGFLDSYLSYSSACQQIALPYTYGTVNACSSFSTYKKASFLILWAFNPVVTDYNPLLFDMLRHHKKKGTPIIVIDPHYSETAALFGTQWIPVRPGTDAALASALAYVLYDEHLCDQHFMDTYCLGFDRDHMPHGFEDAESYHDYIFGTRDGIPKTPEWAEVITGVSAETIVQLARQYAAAKPVALIPGLGNNRVANGEQNVRAMNLLQCMTGNVGIAGGSAGARGFLVQHATPSLPPLANPYNAKIPCFLWTDAIVRGHEMTAKDDRVRGRDQLDADIKLIFNIAGNTLINQHSDINATRALLRDESKVAFIVVSDLFMTPSARFADLLLPAASLFEHDTIANPWHEGDFLLAVNKVIDPPFEAKLEFDWIVRLAEKMGITDFAEGARTPREWLERIYNRLRETETELPDYETFRKNGGYKYATPTAFVAFAEQIADLANNPFPTPSGKIEIFSPRLAEYNEPETIPPIPKYVPMFEGVGDPNQKRYPIQLVGWHTKRRTHSIHDNNDWMESIEPNRLYLHVADAAERGIQDGDDVRVFNDRGSVRIKAKVTERVMRGVVCIPQGAWYTRGENGDDVRGSINTLTIMRPTPLAKGNPQHSNLVQVEAVR